MKFNQKHLTLSDRILIEQGLNEGKSFKAIASSIRKDPTTVSKEVKKHRAVKYHKDKIKKPRCANEKTCLIQQLNEAYLQKDNIYDLLEKGVYSIDIFTQRSTAIAAKIEELQKSMAETTIMYQKTLRQSSHKIDFIPRVTKIVNEYSTLKSADDKNLLLKSVLEKVEYLKGKDCRNDNFDIKIYPLF